MVGEHASEAELENLSSPDVLHFATHGFALGTDIDTAAGRGSLLSGIALAGANRRVGNSQSTDGIVLGYEIEGLDLTSTRLVVVSACDTATGADQSTEGIYNLARAFKIAGAQMALVTVKAVDDQTTPEFMADFYNEWLSNPKDDPALALQTVKARRKRSPQIGAVHSH